MQDLVPDGDKSDTAWCADCSKSSAGQLLMQDRPEVFWSEIFSMYFGKH